MAARKIRALLQTGAKIFVVAPDANPFVRRLAAEKKIQWNSRKFQLKDLHQAVLVFLATGSLAVERRAAAKAVRCGIPVNCAGWPELGTFQVPALLRRGDLQITISSGGASPALVRKLARQLRRQIGPEYARWTALLRKLRPVVLNSVPPDRRSKVFEELASDQFLNLFCNGKHKQAATLAKQIIEVNRRRSARASSHTPIMKKGLKRAD